MAFIKIKKFKGLVWDPEAQGVKKHDCGDCHSCQMCSDDRCALCLSRECSECKINDVTGINQE